MNLSNIAITNTRECECKHPRCNHIIPKGMGYGLRTKHGQAYFCDEHTMLGGLLSYFNEDFSYVGTQKITKLAQQTIGCELECMIDGENERRFNSLKMLLLECGYLDTQDCTVDIEFKSTIQQGLGQISKICNTIDREGFTHCFDSEKCGAHIHGYTSNIEPIRNYYHSLFLPLFYYISDLQIEKRVLIFGRDFSSDWAQIINEYTNPTNHGNFVNVQHNNTIEFRLPHYKNGVQYLTLVKFWREVTFYIEYNFTTCLKPISNQERKNQAKNVGNNLVNIAHKYFD